MRAAAYFRVSVEDQMEGFSLDAQKRDFFEFCRYMGWEVVKTYTEEGRSAWGESIEKRPAFGDMLEDSGSNLFDVVVVNTFDRFSRNLLVALMAFQTLSQNSVAFACVKQDIDYSTPEGRLFMVMLGGFAQYFSDNLSTHTKKGMRERAQQGMFNGEPHGDTKGETLGATESTKGIQDATLIQTMDRGLRRRSSDILSGQSLYQP